MKKICVEQHADNSPPPCLDSTYLLFPCVRLQNLVHVMDIVCLLVSYTDAVGTRCHVTFLQLSFSILIQDDSCVSECTDSTVVQYQAWNSRRPSHYVSSKGSTRRVCLFFFCIGHLLSTNRNCRRPTELSWNDRLSIALCEV